jgi:CDGSH-type Zn-finger protein
MSDLEIAQKAPYIEDTEPGTYYWCACARSGDQPFCDGAHKGTAFTPIEYEVKEQKQLAWCGCKQTKNPPFCDGTHSSL